MKKHNLTKYKKFINFWIPFAIIVVFIRRIITHGFNLNVFRNDFSQELLIGLSSALIVGIFIEYKNKNFN